MKYQVLGHRRKIQKGDIPYELICEFENTEQLYYMMDKVDAELYDSLLVIDTYTNELIASRDLQKQHIKKKIRS